MKKTPYIKSDFGNIYSTPLFEGFTHAHKPTIVKINNEFRIYFGIRDVHNKTHTAFVFAKTQDDLKKGNLRKGKIVLSPGKLGAFDDCGVNVSSILKVNDVWRMYYIGWNTSTTVPMRNSIGCAESSDGENWNRVFEGPIMDRTCMEPYFTVAPYVKFNQDIDLFECWYTSGTEWKIINSRPEIHYIVMYATSKDGYSWKRDRITCLPSSDDLEVTARPFVWSSEGSWFMLFSHRNMKSFRDDRQKSYRIGLAKSIDGMQFNRIDNNFIPGNESWKKEMICYPSGLKMEKSIFIVYNGNGFGLSGFGLLEIGL
jgi:hypothetical protein